MLPRKLMNFAVFVDGRGYIGRCTEATLPDIDLDVEKFRAGGMDTSVDLEKGMAPLDASWSLHEFNPETIKLFGLFSAGTTIVFRGALQRQGERAVSFEVRMTGGLKTIKRDALGVDGSKMMLTANINTYTEIIDGETVIDIDVLNMKRIIGGADQLADIRAAIGA